MKNLYSVLLILLSSIFVNNAYSQFVKNEQTLSFNSTYIGDNELDEADNPTKSASRSISESFLHIYKNTDQTNNFSRIGIGIPIFYNDHNVFNDYMHKCWLRYQFFEDQQGGITHGNDGLVLDEARFILDIYNGGESDDGEYVNYWGSFTNENILISGFQYFGMCDDSNGQASHTQEHNMDHFHGGKLIYDGIDQIFDNDSQSNIQNYKYWLLPKFYWNLPAWALSEVSGSRKYNKLDMFLNIDFEDHDSHHFKFNESYNDCFDEEMVQLDCNDCGWQSSDDYDCDGPEGELFSMSLGNIEWMDESQSTTTEVFFPSDRSL